MRKYSLITCCLLLLFSSCKSYKKTKEFSKQRTIKVKQNKAFDQLSDSYYQQGLKLNPISATYNGDNRYNDLFPDFLSDQYQQRKQHFYQDFKEKLSHFQNDSLSDSQKMSKAVMQWDCDINLKGLSFKENLLMPINQMWTINLTMGQFGAGRSAQPFKTIQDYTNWLKRLEGFNRWLNTAEERMKQGIKQGYVLPKSLIVKVIPQFKALVTPSVEENLFYSPIKLFPKTFSDEDKKQLKTSYTIFLQEKLIPSFKKMYLFLKGDYLKAGRESSGISSLPNGKDYYRYAIKLYTTTDMSADQIYQLGLKEVDRITKEMQQVKQQIGFKGSLKEFFDHIRNSKKLTPYTTAKQVIDHFKAIHSRIEPHLKELFDVTPKTKFEIKRTEKFREASASAEYSQGSLDGSRPGIFYVPIPDAKKYNVFYDEALFLHEAIPGHHYQISLTQENKKLPDFRKTLWYSAYGEGWALYTESLGKQLGLYTDPYQYFGRLNMEMHRAIRLVVDTGMHVKGWSREKAIEYSLDHEADTRANIVPEIERYMANPGQALAYKIGELKIIALRNKAEKEMGKKFDIRKFHDQILSTGCIPLALLENKINRWIEKNK